MNDAFFHEHPLKPPVEPGAADSSQCPVVRLSLGWLIRVVMTAVCQHLAGETCARSAMEAPLVAAEKEKSQA